MLAGASDGASCGQLTRTLRELLPKVHRAVEDSARRRQRRLLVLSNLTSVRLQSFRNDCNQVETWLLKVFQRRVSVGPPVGLRLRIWLWFFGGRWLLLF